MLKKKAYCINAYYWTTARGAIFRLFCVSKVITSGDAYKMLSFFILFLELLGLAFTNVPGSFYPMVDVMHQIGLSDHLPVVLHTAADRRNRRSLGTANANAYTNDQMVLRATGSWQNERRVPVWQLDSRNLTCRKHQWDHGTVEETILQWPAAVSAISCNSHQPREEPSSPSMVWQKYSTPNSGKNSTFQAGLFYWIAWPQSHLLQGKEWS